MPVFSIRLTFKYKVINTNDVEERQMQVKNAFKLHEKTYGSFVFPQ